MESVQEIVNEILSIEEGKGKLIYLSKTNNKYGIVALNHKEINDLIKPNGKKFDLKIVEILGDYEEKVKQNPNKEITNYGGKACIEIRIPKIKTYSIPYIYEKDLEKNVESILNSIKNYIIKNQEVDGR